MLCTGATFVKKSSCLVARTVSVDNAGLHLLTVSILGLHFNVVPFNSVLFESMLASFPAAKK